MPEGGRRDSGRFFEGRNPINLITAQRKFIGKTPSKMGVCNTGL